MRNLLNKTTERLMKDWTSPIYAFFEPTPGIEYHDDCHCHVFRCTAWGCKHHVWQYLDKKDAKSTGNMRKHVKLCWGEAALQAAMECRNTAAARGGVVKSLLNTGSIQTSFDCKGKGKVVSHIVSTLRQRQGLFVFPWCCSHWYDLGWRLSAGWQRA